MPSAKSFRRCSRPTRAHSLSAGLFCLVFCAVLPFMLWSCAPTSGPAPESPGLEALPHPDDVWKTFRTSISTDQAVSFSLSAAMHYSGPKDKGRIVIQFWGNLDYPLRLDLQTGLGQTLSYWREDSTGFTAYLPDKHAAYLHKDGRLGMAAFGIQLPFTLKQMALLLNGAWSELAPAHYTTVRPVKDKGYLYEFTAFGQRYTLIIDPAGRPLDMRTPGPESWHVTFGGALDLPGLEKLPKKITMTRTADQKAVLVLKKLQQSPNPYAKDKLELELPPDTDIFLLENTN